MPRAWYVFNGTTSPDAQYAAGSYRLLNNGNKPACVNGVQICAIYVFYPGSIKPNTPPAPLSINIRQYVTDALGTQVAQPQFPTNAKRYVYLRNSAL